MSQVISDVRKELPKILKAAIGEVKFSDIKFEDGYEEDSEPDEDFVPRKFKALNTDETDDAFNTVCGTLMTRLLPNLLRPEPR